MKLQGFFFLITLLYAGITFAESVTTPIDYINQRDRERLTQILQTVSKKTNMPTKEVHEEFWVILCKQHKGWTEKEIEALRDQLVGASLIYMKYYWEDALESFTKGSPEKSSQRASYEEKLIKLGTLSQEKLKENDENIRRIAFREPLNTGSGPEYVVTEQHLHYTLSFVESAAERISKLFSKEYKE